MQWQTIETAPKDKLMLLDIGLPWPVVGMFNSVNDEFAYADLQSEEYEGGTDIYFQTDYEKNPLHWMQMPDLPSNKNEPKQKPESNHIAQTFSTSAKS